MIDTSHVVKAEHFHLPWMVDRCSELIQDRSTFNRKAWEYAVIAQVYLERKRRPVYLDRFPMALGFGVGKEPLASWLASMGVLVLATDDPKENPAWNATDQHAAAREDLLFPAICPPSVFWPQVRFKPLDMNQIPSDMLSVYDFTWSCGSFEHLGSIQKGIDFFLNQMRCLKPGGIACHTTEYNYLSNDLTLEDPNLVLFRERDLREIESRLESQGDRLFPLDLTMGDSPEDLHVDVYPYTFNPHLKLKIGEHVSTSIVLIAQRGRG